MPADDGHYHRLAAAAADNRSRVGNDAGNLPLADVTNLPPAFYYGRPRTVTRCRTMSDSLTRSQTFFYHLFTA